MIFGDHGHDQAGHHLPGGEATTPALYQGPPLEALLSPGWLREHHGELPELRGQPRAALGLPGRLALVAALSLAFLLALWGAVRAFFPGRPWTALGMAAGLVALRLAGGFLYEPLCLRIHDHGEAPWRSAFLLFPLGGGLLAGRWLLGCAGVLVVLREARISPEQRGLAGAWVALVGGYLALWPAVGMRLAGLDFSFMFRWIPAERYETYWWRIGLGLVAKVALAILWPGLLAISSAGGWRWLLPAVTLKILALALFAAAWGVVGPLTALPGQEALNELGLVLPASALLWAGGWFAGSGVGFRGTSPVLDCPSSSGCAPDACS